MIIRVWWGWVAVTLYWFASTIYTAFNGEPVLLRAVLTIVCAAMTWLVRRSELSGWRR